MKDEYKNEYEKQWDTFLPLIREYSNNRIELLKLSLVEAVAKAVASATSNLILFITLFSCFVFASFATALYIGKLMGEYYLGFAILAAFYLLLFLLTLLLRKNQIEKPILNQTIKKLLEDPSDEK
jgi:Putative Actinobacterial Holin-X, holin superfamily III